MLLAKWLSPVDPTSSFARERRKQGNHMTIQPEFATVQTNGIRLRVALAGKGPLVVLVHGWPESWYSWRHQIPALAEAGYRVAAPDVRGYGGSDKPAAIEAYAIKQMCADIAGLVEGLGERQAILVGHDWGAPIVWNTSLFFPQRVRAVAGLSVPHAGRGPAPRIELFRNIYKDRFFYQLYFQEPGVAEAELETDVRASLRKTYYAASGEGRKAAAPGPAKPADAKYLDGLVDPNPLPDWLTPEDLDYYAGEFARSGFRGPLNRYRNSELDFAQQAEIADRPVEQPAAFIAGSLDPVLGFLPGVDLVARMRERVSDLRLVRIIDGAGHWVQQERPAEVNAALLEFLGGLA
jgi:pimeloyl-ACP methyl ester carboxylesterase